MKFIFHLLRPLIFFASCAHSQSQKPISPKLIGTCEGCEAIFEYGNKKLSSVDTLPDFKEEGQRIKISGTIFKPDGKTPAKDVILYVYHTNQQGFYPNRENKEDWARRHGYIRGWVKTGNDGHYAFYTLKPGIYPDRAAAAHIHPTILEPDGKYYWVEDYYFAGDTLLTEKEKNPSSPRCGTAGVLNLKKEGDIWVAERDFILGKNVPDYSYNRD